MSIWTDFIAINETEIVRLQVAIDMMLDGTLDMRTREEGKWVSHNATWISEDRVTIARLKGLVTKARVELGMA